MPKLLDDLYLCPITGQNIQVSNDKVECVACEEAGDCKKSLPNIIGCSVLVDANHAYAQSRPKCTRTREYSFAPSSPDTWFEPVGPGFQEYHR